MGSILEMSPSLIEIFRGLGMEDEKETAINVLTTGLKELLIECEKEILEFEIKYGFTFEKFKEELDKGKLGDPHSYPLEKDAMIWEDMVKEKQNRLASLRKLEMLSV